VDAFFCEGIYDEPGGRLQLNFSPQSFSINQFANRIKKYPPFHQLAEVCNFSLINQAVFNGDK
jgi:hypothetical protein